MDPAEEHASHDLVSRDSHVSQSVEETGAPTSVGRLLKSAALEVQASIDRVLSSAARVTAGALSDEQHLAMVDLEGASNEVITAVNGLRDIADFESGDLTLETVPFRIGALLADTVANVKPFAAATGHEIRFRSECDGDEVVVGDPIRLRDVIVRAIRYVMDVSDGQTVHVAATSMVVPSGRCTLSFDIRDTPPGADDNKAPAGEGAVLPETLQGRVVSDLVAAMGGRLWMRQDADNVRVEVAVDLPVHSVSAAPGETESHSAETDPPVLVVSDSLERRRALVSVLASAGLAPLTLAYPYTADALEHIVTDSEHPPRAALIEVAEEPLEACEEFLNQTDNTIPVTVLVTSGRRGDAAQCRASGIAAYLAHPVGPGDVADALRATIDVPVRSSLVTRHWLREGRRTLEILIADDSPVNARLVSHLLEARGHAVTIVTDGEQAVNEAVSGSFHIVLMDVLMPVMTGIAASRAIRRAEDGSRLPIVAMTAFAQQASREVCLGAGMDDYVTKPWKPEELIAIVEQTATRSSGSGAGKSLAPTP